MAKDSITLTKTPVEPHQLEEQKSIKIGEVDGAILGRGELEVVELRERVPLLRKLKAAEAWLDKKFGIETTGADRIPEDQRRPPSILNMIFLWFSMQVTPGLITLGLLGPLFGLSVNESIIVSIFGTVIGSVIPAFTATLGAPTGLRQIAVSRFAFGIWGSKFCGLLNILINMGFATIDCIIAGQLISAVSGGKVTVVAGIIILSVGSWIISLFGFRITIFGQSAKYFSPTPGLSHSSGDAKTGAALNYFALVFTDISKWLVFCLTGIGLVLPTVFVLVLGNFYGGTILTDQALSAIYDDGGIGALNLATMSPSGWGKFVCVMYALSFLAGVTVIYYSSSLSIQQWGKHFMAVPRFVWNTLLAAISLALAWGGREHLTSVIVDFLSLLGYWTVCFGTILAFENFWFRPRNGGYDLEGWQDQDRMPLGIAGCVSLALGIGVSFLGMDQTWYVGPAAKAVGPDGGDLGNYITLIAVCLAYPPLRHYEIKFTGR
ncbi:putative NCS family nucleoside transporter [Lophiotrema nucula]|uniref:Putative NCS family nucleoside transporter n=1 Tax=Lophiotrema nucula TaxID=690887 RepID=A0A6A5ZLL4_9PLEO|nr:putative NCS family nucleoside transporter [Lophiotrema nucula]